LKLSKEFKIGVIVIISLALLYWGFNFLKGENIFSKERIFLAVYKDVSGLNKANAVIINGLNVGHVRDMYFSGNGDSRVLVEMILNDPIPIPKNSVAKIISSDLLGSKTVEILLGSSSEIAVSGDTLNSEIEASIKEEVNRQLQPLKNKAEGLLTSIDTILTMLNGLFNKSNMDNVSKSVAHMANSFENIESTTDNLDEIITQQRGRIEMIIKNIEAISANLKNNEGNLDNILTNFASISDTLSKAKLSQTVHNLQNTLNQLSLITERINSGQGSIGMLVNDDSLYIELKKSSRDLNILLEDIRQNPKKYLKFSVF
jgi:phospholipid/cholesterol/gamma-HCH transport system substrate-binding protein